MATAEIVRPSYVMPAAGGEIDGDALAAWFNAIITFLEAANLRSGNVLTSTTGADRDVVLVGDVNQIVESLKTFLNTAAAAGGIRNTIRLGVNPASGTQANEDGVRVDLMGQNDSGSLVSFGSIDLVFTSVSDTSEESRVVIRLQNNGTLDNVLEVSTDAIYPSVNEGIDVGTDTNRFDSIKAQNVVLDRIDLVDTSGGHHLLIENGSAFTGDRVFTLITGDAARTLTINDNTVLGGGDHSGTNTGDQTITLTGEVTGSGTGSFAATITNKAVTNAKLRDSSALSVIGRGANTSGVPGDLGASTSGHVLRLSGTALAFGTLIADSFADDTIADSRLISDIAVTATANAIVKRDSDGRFAVGTPVGEEEASNKGYVDQGITQEIFRHPHTIIKATTISSNYNAISAGPLTIDATVTVEEGATWAIV